MSESTTTLATPQADLEDTNPLVEDVESTAFCTWNIVLREVGGELFADWDSNTDFEPDYATLVLFVAGKEVARHKTGKRRGTHLFAGRVPGKGYSLALVATGFRGGEAAVAKTRESKEADDFPLSQEAKHQYRIALSQQGRKTLLTWGEPGSRNDPSFKPRSGKLFLDIEGENSKEYDITDWHGSIPTGVRWGLGLKARYTADSFGHHHHPPRIEIVSIATRVR